MCIRPDCTTMSLRSESSSDETRMFMRLGVALRVRVKTSVLNVRAPNAVSGEN